MNKTEYREHLNDMANSYEESLKSHYKESASSAACLGLGVGCIAAGATLLLHGHKEGLIIAGPGALFTAIGASELKAELQWIKEDIEKFNEYTNEYYTTPE